MSAPATPNSKPAPGRPDAPAQPGTWKHPQFDQVVRRHNDSTFTRSNLRRCAWNFGGLITLWFSGKILQNLLPSVFQPGKPATQYTKFISWACTLLFVYNLAMACWPLVASPDEVNDIALTPAQRKLMGLAPSSAPPTPGSSYVTPPRYARTPTPMSNSPSSKDRYSESPSARRESPGTGSVTGSPFSPGASPLLQKAVGGGYNSSRRDSYGSGSPLGFGGSRSTLLEAPPTPTPSGTKGANLGLNSKWLYEKSRRNSGKLF